MFKLIFRFEKLMSNESYSEEFLNFKKKFK